VHAIDYDGKDGPEGHPDLKGFGRHGRVFFWLRQGDADAKAPHIGFVAKSEAEVNAFYEAAMAAGATDNGKPGARLYYDVSTRSAPSRSAFRTTISGSKPSGRFSPAAWLIGLKLELFIGSLPNKSKQMRY
jgi:hypothetical protein